MFVKDTLKRIQGYIITLNILTKYPSYEKYSVVDDTTRCVCSVFGQVVQYIGHLKGIYTGNCTIMNSAWKYIAFGFIKFPLHFSFVVPLLSPFSSILQGPLGLRWWFICSFPCITVFIRGQTALCQTCICKNLDSMFKLNKI